MELNDTLNIVKAGASYYLYIDGKKMGVYGNPIEAMNAAMDWLGRMKDLKLGRTCWGEKI